MIEVKYFGAIAELTSLDTETISLKERDLSIVVAELTQKYQFESIPYSVAVNQKIIASLKDYQLNDNDVVALLPPFAGG